jgi:hypothetical protein
MPYTYSAGSATPVAAGMVEYGTIRINDGTFITNSILGLREPPTIRRALTALGAVHGEFASGAQYGSRLVAVDLTAQQAEGDIGDCYQAIDALQEPFMANPSAIVPVYFTDKGWTGRRFINALLENLSIENPEQGRTKTPWRSVLMQLRAADPRIYSETLRTLQAAPAASVALPNVGNLSAPPVMDFYGPFTTLRATRPDGKFTEIASALPNGEYVRVDVLARTVIRSGNGNSWLANMNGLFLEVNPSTAGQSWTVAATGTTGAATKVVFSYRDTWIS